VVVFNPTQVLREQNFKDAFIKRVIGVPGDQVLVKNGQVYVNSKPIQEKYISQPPDYDFGPVVVPENSYLVLGDNRNNSYDSHYWGYVPRQNLVGKAFVRFWPLDRMGPLDKQPLYPETPETPTANTVPVSP
jgi:signal peptidase I